MNDELEKLERLERRSNILNAVTKMAGPDFLEQHRLLKRKEFLEGFPMNKWLWGALAISGIVLWLGFDAGKWMLFLWFAVLVGGMLELILVEFRLNALSHRLDRYCFEWLAGGFDYDQFWAYGRLKVREWGLKDDAAREEYKKAERKWWSTVKQET